MSLTFFFDDVLVFMDANGRNGRAVGNDGVRLGCGRSELEDGDVGEVGDASGEEIMGTVRAALKAGTVTVIAGVMGGELEVKRSVFDAG